MSDDKWRRVSRDEWLTFIRQFPQRHSYRTAICEPPKEICEWPEGRVIATVTYGDVVDGKPRWDVTVYEINTAVQP